MASEYQVIKGRKFDKVVRVVGEQRDVQAFVERGTGVVREAASWFKPGHRMTSEQAAQWVAVHEEKSQ